jgi:RNA polymerase sigma factor (sigma-70 family)
MAEAHPNPFLDHIRHLIGSVPAAALTDGQLLERFLTGGDEEAVAVLVRRYARLVFGVCRRVLYNDHAAEDAFQATFLVLMRKAPSLDRDKPLGSWLYTVAYRLALRARANAARRKRCEEQAARIRPPADDMTPRPNDLIVVLEEELQRLPERHRVALVLCYLDGKTNNQAAEILGCPQGSMAARLARARERLRESLARRGFVAPAATLVAALTAAASQAAVSLPLLENTVRAALWFAREDAGIAGFVSTQAVALAKGAVRTMFLNRLKLVGVLVLAAVTLGTGAAMLLHAAYQADLLVLPVEKPADEARPWRADVPDRNANAAVQYGQAFIALRRGVGDQEKLIAECLTMPLDAHAREIVNKMAYALRTMRRGAALPRCDWAIDPEQGIDIPYTHGDGARVLSSLACLRARMRFEEGKSAEALSDIVSALALARHVSRDSTLDSLRACYAIEHRMSELLALYLPKLDAKTIKDLKMRLDTLPPGGSVATATMRMEEALLKWIVGEVQEAKDKENLLAFLSQLCGWKSDPPERNREKGRAFLAKCGGTAEGVLKYSEQMRQSYALLAKKLDLPPDQVAKEFEREEKKQAGNPVFKVFAPVLHNVRWLRAQADVRRALLSAALAIQLDGRDALKKHPDPVAGGPFEYVAHKDGFELRSKLKLDDQVQSKWNLKVDDKPLPLTVGRRGK